jgi:hypothetical protein
VRPTIDVATVTNIAPGLEVEVRTRFTAHWSSGFEVDRVVGDRVLIRRRSDGVVLPLALSADEIRVRATA